MHPQTVIKKPRKVPSRGTCIRAAREALGLSQRALGSRVGASARTVMRWEMDQCAPPPKATERLLDALAAAPTDAHAAVARALGHEERATARAGAIEGALTAAVAIADAKPSALRAAIAGVLDAAIAQRLSLEQLRAMLG